MIKINGYLKRAAIFLLCAVITLSVFVSCDDDGDGGYREPSGTNVGDGETDDGGNGSSDNVGGDGGETDNGGADSGDGNKNENSLPTVEFPIVPLD